MCVCVCVCVCCSRQAEIVPFFTVIETDRGVADMILDYSISQTTLEEVFLNVCIYTCTCMYCTILTRGGWSNIIHVYSKISVRYVCCCIWTTVSKTYSHYYYVIGCVGYWHTPKLASFPGRHLEVRVNRLPMTLHVHVFYIHMRFG